MNANSHMFVCVYVCVCFHAFSCLWVIVVAQRSVQWTRQPSMSLRTSSEAAPCTFFKLTKVNSSTWNSHLPVLLDRNSCKAIEKTQSSNARGQASVSAHTHTHTLGNTLTCFPLVGGFNLDIVPTFFKDQAPPALFHSCLVSLFKETDVVYSSVELLSRRESLCFCTEMRQSQSLNKPSGIFLATATVYGQHNYITIAWLIVRQVKKRVVFWDHSNQIESARKTTVANTKPLRLQKNCFYNVFFGIHCNVSVTH